MERRGGAGVLARPLNGPGEGPFRAPIKAGLRGLPWDARPLRRKGLRLPAHHTVVFIKNFGTFHTRLHTFCFGPYWPGVAAIGG
jgi:hypothetical protein